MRLTSSINKILLFSIFFALFNTFCQPNEVLNKTNTKENNNSQIKKNDINKKEEPSKKDEDSKSKKIKGYFGKLTSFYDKDGKPKLLSKDFKSLTMEELEHNRAIHMQNNQKDVVARYTERMITVCKDPSKICNLRLEIADLCYELNKFEKAAFAYSEFVKMYPGNANIEQAAFRSIESRFKLTLPSDKDQGHTKENLQDAKNFLANTTYKKNRDKVKKIAQECIKKLLGAELNVFNYYLDKKNLKAAQQRYDYIKKEFFSESSSDKSILIELEKQLKALKENNKYKPNYSITTNSPFLPSFFGGSPLPEIDEQKNTNDKIVKKTKKPDYTKVL